MLLISLIGGIAAFGSVGLVAGPALMAAAVALFDVFTSAPGTDATEVDQNSETAGASKEGAAGSRDDMKANDARESGARELSHATARR